MQSLTHFRWTRANKCSLACTLALALFHHAGHAQATGNATPSFSFGGFGTVGVAHSTEENADFIAQDLQATGAGRGRAWSPDVDSRLGVQLSAQLTPQLSGVLQVVSEQRHDASYNPRVEWANLKYEFTPDFSVRAGRIVLPILMVSDSRKVGYAQPWVRPPVEVYSLIPLTSSDGIDFSYRMHFGEVNNTLQVGIGGTSAATPDGGDAKSKDGWLLSNTLEYGDTSFHFAYSRSKLTVEPFKVLFDGYREYAAGAAQLSQGVTQYAAMSPPIGPVGCTCSGGSIASKRHCGKI